MTKLEFEKLGKTISVEDIPAYIDATNFIGYNDSENRPSSASSIDNPSNSSSKAFDGDLKTDWKSITSSKPEWLSIDLGSIKKNIRCKIVLGIF